MTWIEEMREFIREHPVTFFEYVPVWAAGASGVGVSGEAKVSSDEAKET